MTDIQSIYTFYLKEKILYLLVNSPPLFTSKEPSHTCRISLKFDEIAIFLMMNFDQLSLAHAHSLSR